MKFAAIGPIAIHLPEKVEDNDALAAEFPKWNMRLIQAKTGIRQRHIAAPDECASDLGVAAAEKLFAEYDIDRNTIDYLLFCTQSPDYVLPTTACVMQDRWSVSWWLGATALLSPPVCWRNRSWTSYRAARRRHCSRRWTRRSGR